MGPLTIVRRRMREQRLAGEPFADPAEAVGFLGAMQSQEFAEAKWSISERTGGLTDAEVQEAFDRGEILRTHVLRPTWHFVTPADIRWMLRLTAPRVHAGNRSRYRDLGLDSEVLARSHELMAQVLGDGDPRTRRELGEALARAGLDTDGQRLAHTVMHAELEQLIVSGPRRGRQHTYLLFDDRVPPAVDRAPDDPLAELASRFFTSHGPATVRDFCWWSGLKVADARAGVEAAGDRLAVAHEDAAPWFAAPVARSQGETGGAFLIPMYDELGVGYRDLRMVMPEQPPRDGLMSRPIVIAGATVGSWKRTLSTRAVVVQATLFKELSKSETKKLVAVVERFGSFLQLPATLETEQA